MVPNYTTLKNYIASIPAYDSLPKNSDSADFIAKDMNITMASLETRLRRAKERESKNGNQGAEPRAGSGDDDRAGSQEG